MFTGKEEKIIWFNLWINLCWRYGDGNSGYWFFIFESQIECFNKMRLNIHSFTKKKYTGQCILELSLWPFVLLIVIIFSYHLCKFTNQVIMCFSRCWPAQIIEYRIYKARSQIMTTKSSLNRLFSKCSYSFQWPGFSL